MCVQINTKSVFPVKKNYYQILHIQINLGSKFQFQETFLIFGTNFKKNVVKNVKNEHH